MTRKHRRQPVDRTERVKPTPEAAQHHRPWPLMLLLHLGPDANGLDSDEFEAGIEIVETFRSLTAQLQISNGQGLEHIPARTGSQLSDRTALMISVWFAWAKDIGPIATHLVEQIEDAVPIRSVEVLRLGLRRWLKLKRDALRGVDNAPNGVALPKHVSWSYGETHGGRGSALPISPPSTSPSSRTIRTGTGAQASLRSAATRR